MPQALSYLKETASQTAGPYFHIGLIPGMAGFDIFEKNFSNVLVTPDTKGERISLEGRVLDGTGSPLRDVLLELWQANASGRYHHPADRSEMRGTTVRAGNGWSARRASTISIDHRLTARAPSEARLAHAAPTQE